MRSFVDLWLRGSRHRHRSVFSRISRQNVWGNAESVSGPGSTRDAPCGDFNWAGPLADAVDAYIGVDVVEELTARNVRDYGSAKRTFLTKDITRDPLPQADLVLSRDSFVHFSFADIRAALRNFHRSGAEYVLTTTFIDRTSNRNIRTGNFRVLNLQTAPFDFPAPLALVDEHCTHFGGIFVDKRLALWRLADLPI